MTTTDALASAGAGASLVVEAPARRRGAALVDLRVPRLRAEELCRCASTWPSWRLTRRQSCDLELLAAGGFSPLSSFMGEADHRSVCASMRLADGTLWPIPITLDVTDETMAAAEVAGMLALRDDAGTLQAMLHVTESWRPDLFATARAVFGTVDPAHPGVETLLRRTHRWHLTGRLEVVRLPAHSDHADLRRTPAELRAEFARRGWDRVVAFQTRNPMHRAHQELTLRASRDADAGLLIHPVVGVTKPGDIHPAVRVRCYRALLPSYPAGRALLAVLPLAMRMAGPREAVWHALIRRNYGATHFIVGRNHASPGTDSRGRPFYGTYDAAELLRQHAAELGVRIMSYPRIVYDATDGSYRTEDELPPGRRGLSISGTELRQRLAEGRNIPAWLTPPEVAAELRQLSRAPVGN